MTSVVVEEDDVSIVFEGVPGSGSNNMRESLIANSGSVDEENDDDVRPINEFSNFKSPSSEDEFNLILQGRSNELGLHLDIGYLGNGLDLGFELDHGLTLGSIVNTGPRALFWLERSTPDDFNSYPSSPVEALGNWEEDSKELQIVPSSTTTPINSAGFNTPTTSSGHVVYSS
ncbi:hypothetical protein MRB53_022555 [Persea americana]|uniref:Uncharacterized protein n=1 Tax=Persea americana TaxID=3435 RepID=A0ACC2L6Z4_PERAE|nr:hypothetical protein MRB53_022555 [Persea americana]